MINSINNNTLQEAFGAGTAATIAPIKTIGYENKDYDLPKNDSSSLSSKFLDLLDGIKYGLIDDNHNWITKL